MGSYRILLDRDQWCGRDHAAHWKPVINIMQSRAEGGDIIY